MFELLFEMAEAVIIFVVGVAILIGGFIFKHRQKKD